MAHLKHREPATPSVHDNQPRPPTASPERTWAKKPSYSDIAPPGSERHLRAAHDRLQWALDCHDISTATHSSIAMSAANSVVPVPRTAHFRHRTLPFRQGQESASEWSSNLSHHLQAPTRPQGLSLHVRQPTLKHTLWANCKPKVGCKSRSRTN